MALCTHSLRNDRRIADISLPRTIREADNVAPLAAKGVLGRVEGVASCADRHRLRRLSEELRGMQLHSGEAAKGATQLARQASGTAGRLRELAGGYEASTARVYCGDVARW
jgi:hypothetical protein